MKSRAFCAMCLADGITACNGKSGNQKLGRRVSREFVHTTTAAMDSRPTHSQEITYSGAPA